MSPRRTQPCIEACPFPAEQRGNLGCRPSEAQVRALGERELLAFGLCMNERMNRRDVDVLTDLLTYDRFLAEAQRHIQSLDVAYGRRVKTLPQNARSALVGFADGDGLKAANDGKLGHAGGDRIIRATGKATLSGVLGRRNADDLVLGCFREGEALAARRSGDEFVYVLLGLDEGSAATVQERVVERLSNIHVRGFDVAMRATVAAEFIPRLTSFGALKQAIHRVDTQVNLLKQGRRASQPRQ